MDDIAPYRRASAPIAPASRGPALPGHAYAQGHHHGAAGSTPYGPDLAAVKTTGHYVGALRRRFWLALLVAVPMGVLTSIYALRQPKIYQAVAQIRIQQPHYDEALSALVQRDLGPSDASGQAGYAADMVTDLQGRGIADRVVADIRLGAEVAHLDDPAMELIVSNIAVKPVNKSNTYVVTLNGRNPSLTRRLLEAEIDELKKYAENKRESQINQTKEHTNAALRNLKREADALETTMLNQIETLGTIGPGGRNILEEQYAHLGQSIEMQQARVVELQQKMMFAPLFPREEMVSPKEAAMLRQREQLEEAKEQLIVHMEDIRDKSRKFDFDPAAIALGKQLKTVMRKINEIDAASFSQKKAMAADPTEMLHDSLQRDIDASQGQRHDLLVQLRKAMPEHQKHLNMKEQHDSLRGQISEMEQSLSAFEILAKSQTTPIELKGQIAEPIDPIKPNRPVSIVMGLVVSLAMGLGLVFLLEHLDRSVREPEHVSHGLALPLLGVVPRLPRTALTHRGGHIWTSAAPDSAGADAYRNIRASLLGAADRLGPIVSLLVTSAKAGDGKSTAALNLAAACARAGERTLLLDVDLRRPTLAEVFPGDAHDEDSRLGLVDVLKGSVPWQATLRHTDLHNLDFIPTGDARGVPVEILGTLELRQLLTALTHHYDRVILDGPAILGMADCRVLGRMVDAAMLVVRAGAHQTMTLQRAKAVLEQSHVEIAGVIVNGLSQGVENWSSYGYGPAPAVAYRRDDRALPAASPSPARADALAGAPADA